MRRFVFQTTLLLMSVASVVQGTLTILPPGPMVGSHVGNLVVDGSFEPGPDIIAYWAPGATNTPFGTPPGWTAAGPTSNYAQWGRDTLLSSIKGSDKFPDGRKGMYFGDFQSAIVSPTPTFHANGEITFASPGTVGNTVGGPVVLSQSIPTNVNVAPSYILSFWASGESALAGGMLDGIFGLRVTNTEAGDPFHYLTAPGGSISSLVGASHRYEFEFTPLNPSLPVTVEFYNWGHFGFGGGTTELVLDDVIVNTVVPEPTSLALLGLASSALLVRRKKH